MIPLLGVPDVDAIAQKFFVAKGKARHVQFHAGKGVEVYLELEHEKYQEILLRLEELETVDRDVATQVCSVNLM